MQCKICEFECKDLKTFSYHIFGKHKIKSEQYTIDYLYNGVKPFCAVCENDTRYVAFEFKKYCKEHSKLAESEAGKIGGKIKQTWNKGQTKETNEIIKSQAENMTGELNHFFGKKHSEETMNNLLTQRMLTQDEYENRIKEREAWLKVLTPYKDYLSRQHQYLSVHCISCGNISNKTLQAFERGSQCLICYPLSTDSSEEKEVKDWISSLGMPMILNSRKIISPKELDIYIPSKNFAIEYNGLYWHSEENVLKEHHSNKTSLCKDNKIQLFHIFSDEWKFKQSIVKSMISNRLGLITNKIMARKTVVKEIEANIANSFYDSNHLSGATKSKIHFGLYHNDELVSCLSLRSPRHKIYTGSLEISRFASKLDTVVTGGFSKILNAAKAWSINNDYKSIITYADLRFGEGNVYKNNGFQFVKNTELDYWYTDNVLRYDRLKYKAKDGLTEKQVAEQSKVYRIYGCGSALYKMSL